MKLILRLSKGKKTLLIVMIIMFLFSITACIAPSTPESILILAFIVILALIIITMVVLIRYIVENWD